MSDALRKTNAIERVEKALSTEGASIADLLSQVRLELRRLNTTLERFLEIEEEKRNKAYDNPDEEKEHA